MVKLLNLEADLLFLDVNTAPPTRYFELEEPDEPVARGPDDRTLGGQDGAAETDRTGFRTYGKSKDSRDGLPPGRHGMAVTRDEIAVRCWCWLGNASDHELIRQSRTGCRTGPWPRSSGSPTEASLASRTTPRRGDHHCMIGWKLRSGSPKVKAALLRRDRYNGITEKHAVKEVRISDTERFVICHNPEAPARDNHMRDQLTAQLAELIDGSDQLSDFKRGELHDKIAGKPGLNRLLRHVPARHHPTSTQKIYSPSSLSLSVLILDLQPAPC
jgi:hypothetical protein